MGLGIKVRLVSLPCAGIVFNIVSRAFWRGVRGDVWNSGRTLFKTVGDCVIFRILQPLQCNRKVLEDRQWCFEVFFGAEIVGKCC